MIVNQSPLVSVIIATYNRAQLVTRAINSVINQSYYNLECIVIDDGSTDNTGQIVKSINDKRIIYLCHKNNRHASAARNTGIKVSKGQFISFLDDDDEWHPTKLEKQISLILQLPNQFGMVYCWMDYYKDRKLVLEHHPTHRGNVFAKVLDQQRIGGCPTLLIRKNVLDDIGLFDETVLRGNDGDLIRRICLKYQVDFVPEVLVDVHIGHGLLGIGNNSKESVKNAIYGQQIKFKKFNKELNHLPKHKSIIYAYLGFYYSQINMRQKSIDYYYRSFITYPINILLFKMVIKSIMVYRKNKNPGG